MVPKRMLVAVVAALLSASAFAQSAETPAQPMMNPAEFGRVSGGELALIGKTSQHWSGSFGLMTSASKYPFAASGMGSSRGYDATLGGTLIKDRAWFFVAADRRNSVFGSQFNATVPQTVVPSSRIVDLHANALLGSNQALTSSLATQQPALIPNTGLSRASSTFMSLHYTGIVTDSMFFTANVTRSGGTTQAAAPPQ